MKVRDFYYELPEELIAQEPLKDRSSSRLLLLNRKTGEVTHEIFKNIINYLNENDCLVINDTRVIPARLLGKKENTGGRLSLLLKSLETCGSNVSPAGEQNRFKICIWRGNLISYRYQKTEIGL